jgi:hypothetical protein
MNMFHVEQFRRLAAYYRRITVPTDAIVPW